ncbi:hypothetical protein [uncultured Kriegella sp.]|uniref:hypothetical protein n=1 Tax=uncultured Kriegella sp. TaxID=1798910 RepID=UPI0030D8E831|tara:strand:+ start:64713 stop:65066 length:354 start_codon:yes stop_codon:yes gene_type:complete
MKTSKEMKTRLLLIGCSVAMVSFISGCSKDSPLNPSGNCFGGNWAAQYADELQAWSNAATTYSEEPNQTNCANYKNAATSYLNALNDIYDCVPNTSRAEIDRAINEAKADIDEESCD